MASDHPLGFASRRCISPDEIDLVSLQDEECIVMKGLADIAARAAGHLSMPGLIELHLPGAAQEHARFSLHSSLIVKPYGLEARG